MRRALLLSCLALFAAGCGPVEARVYGERLFADPAFSSSTFNTFSCATCHTVGGSSGGLLPSGYDLENSAFRRSWWGGYAASLLDAVNYCNVYFMRGEPLDRDDVKGRALYEYLVSVSPRRDEPTLPVTIVETASPLAAGDAARGEAVWDGACRVCHGAAHTGDGRISDRVEPVPESSIGYATRHGVDPGLVVVEKVRHGQFFGVGGNMPLYSLEALSDEQLADLLAFLGL